MDTTDDIATGLTTTSLERIVMNGVGGTGLSSQAHLESKAVTETRALAAELCCHFYSLGWVSGAGGSIAMRVHDDAVPKPSQLIVTSSSGIYIHLFLSCLFLYVNINRCRHMHGLAYVACNVCWL